MAGDDDDQRAEVEDGTVRYPSGGAPPQPFHVIIPENPEPIVTERLCLRHMKPEHAEGIFAVRSGQEYIKFDKRFVPDTSVEQTKKWMTSKTFTEPPLAAGRSFIFVITVRDDPAERVIGTMGFNQVVPLPNIGFGLIPETWGRGYATEALNGLLRAWWALPREEQDGNGAGGGKVYANCNKINEASFKVLKKAGFEVYHELVFDDGTCLCLSAGETLR